MYCAALTAFCAVGSSEMDILNAETAALIFSYRSSPLEGFPRVVFERPGIALHGGKKRVSTGSAD